MHYPRALLRCGSVVVFFCVQTSIAQEPAAPPRPARAPDLGRVFFGLSTPPDPETAERGQKLFVANCGFCHGSNGNGGNSGPDLVRSVLVLHDEGSGTQIGPVILNGRPDKGMPKFALSESQVKDLAQFLLGRSQSAVNRMNYKILNVVTGNAESGRSTFQQRCSACHSAEGDLAHIATKYEPVALQSRFLYPIIRTYPGMPSAPVGPRSRVTVKVTLPSGNSYSGVLKAIDDFSVSLIDSDGEYHSWPLSEDSHIQVQIQDPLKGHEELLKQYKDADMHNILAYLETLK